MNRGPLDVIKDTVLYDDGEVKSLGVRTVFSDMAVSHLLHVNTTTSELHSASRTSRVILNMLWKLGELCSCSGADSKVRTLLTMFV